MKSLIILSIYFKKSKCECKSLRITNQQLDRLSVETIHIDNGTE